MIMTINEYIKYKYYDQISTLSKECHPMVEYFAEKTREELIKVFKNKNIKYAKCVGRLHLEEVSVKNPYIKEHLK